MKYRERSQDGTGHGKYRGITSLAFVKWLIDLVAVEGGGEGDIGELVSACMVLGVYEARLLVVL
jgi:hypothetical protein